MNYGELLYWWLGLFGSIASLIGLPIAIWQIYKTRRAAEAAKDASRQTQEAISRNLLLSDVSNCIRHIEEVRLYLQNESYDLAQMRVNDLLSQLIQIHGVLKSSNQTLQIDFEAIVLEVTKIRNNFSKKVDGGFTKPHLIRVRSQLDIISDSLNKLLGENKIFIEKGE